MSEKPPDSKTTDSDSLGWHPEEKTPDDIIVTPEMIGAGMRAFTEVLQRHNLDGLLSLGCFWNGLGEAYRAMEFARAKAT